jgi:hypothetical protein
MTLLLQPLERERNHQMSATRPLRDSTVLIDTETETETEYSEEEMRSNRTRWNRKSLSKYNGILIIFSTIEGERLSLSLLLDLCQQLKLIYYNFKFIPY